MMYLLDTCAFIWYITFDCILIATAIERDLTLLTNDSEIIKYEVKKIWQSQKEEK